MSYQPDLYDVVTRSAFHGDVQWYRDRALASGGPVLELGAGTGRVALAIAEAGIAIHALDSDPRMLQVLRAKLAAQQWTSRHASPSYPMTCVLLILANNSLWSSARFGASCTT